MSKGLLFLAENSIVLDPLNETVLDPLLSEGIYLLNGGCWRADNYLG